MTHFATVQHVAFHQSPAQVLLLDGPAAHAGVQPTGGKGPMATREARVPVATDQVADLLEQLSEQIQQLMSGRRESIAVLHQVAIDLAVSIAGKILFTRIEADEFPLAQMIDELLDHVDAHESVTVLLNPQDHELLQQLDTGETGGHAVIEQVNWLASPDLPRGAARLDASSFALFYDPTIQLGEIRQSLLEILHEAEIERRQIGLPGQGLRRFPERRASG